MTLIPLVVIYNRSCADSETCRSLQRQTLRPQRILIFDNSTADYGNRTQCQESGWEYLSGGGNLGLSKAYNLAAKYLLKSGAEGYLCLLDDDTALPDTFLAEMSQEAEGGADIFVPILTHEGSIVSPSRLTSSRGRRFFHSVQECLEEKGENLQAFNSCMTVSLDIYRDYRYDERIFLDGVDHAFLRDMRALDKTVAVARCQCEHGFSGVQRGSREGELRRFAVYAKDSQVLYEDSPWTYWTVVGRRGLHLCLRHRSLAFLKPLFTHGGKV